MRQKTDKLNLSPSICAAPTSDYQTLIKKLLASKIKTFHFDLMDGSVTPNAWINLQLLKLLPNEVSAEVHIMASNPIKFIKNIPYKENTFVQTHLRMQQPYLKFIKEVKKYHLLPGITFDLNDNLKIFDFKLLKEISWVNFMSVKKIGLTNQIFCDSVIKKIKQFKNLFPDWKGHIGVDGSVRQNHLQALKQLCDSVVVGSILYNCDDYKKQLKVLNECCNQNK